MKFYKYCGLHCLRTPWDWHCKITGKNSLDLLKLYQEKTFLSQQSRTCVGMSDLLVVKLSTELFLNDQALLSTQQTLIPVHPNSQFHPQFHPGGNHHTKNVSGILTGWRKQTHSTPHFVPLSILCQNTDFPKHIPNGRRAVKRTGTQEVQKEILLTGFLHRPGIPSAHKTVNFHH